MRYLLAVDWFILYRVERFCHWSQRNFGIRSYVWAKACYGLASVAYAIDAISAHGTERGIGIFFASGFAMFAVLFKPRAYSETMNPLKISPSIAGVRLGLFLAMPLSVIARSYSAPFVAFGAYCLAVDDLPLGPSRFGQWVKSLKAGLKQAAPVPVAS